MQHIARLLEIPGQTGPPSPAYVGGGVYSTRSTVRNSRENRPLFHTGRVPGFAAPHREAMQGVLHRADESRCRKNCASPNRIAINTSRKSSIDNGIRTRSRESSANRLRSREGSPRMPRPRSEEIPLELIKKTPNSIVESPKISILPRPQTPRVETEPSTSRDGLVQETSITKISEETSFMAEERVSTPKKKGLIETI